MTLTNEIKQKIVERLIPLHPEKIILFGSYAYGTPNEDSDLDLCVVYKKKRPRVEEYRKIYQCLREIDLPKDILIPSTEEFDFYKNEINSVYSDIDRHGIVLWKHK